MEASYNILVIDDDAFMRDACRQTLTKDGHSVTLAKSGHEGLSLLEKWSFDLILLDLKMPGEDGLSILANIKDLDPEAIVVMITGYGSIETAVKAIKLGAFDFIAKPFTPDELLKLVSRVMRHRRLTIENLYLRQSLSQETQPKQIISKSPPMAKVKEMMDAGVKIQACKACADLYGVSPALSDLGIEVKYMGQPLSQILQNDDWDTMTF